MSRQVDIGGEQVGVLDCRADIDEAAGGILPLDAARQTVLALDFRLPLILDAQDVSSSSSASSR